MLLSLKLGNYSHHEGVADTLVAVMIMKNDVKQLYENLFILIYELFL